MRVRVGVVDYGRGNLHSIIKALKFIDADTIVALNAHAIQDVHLLILPGVGAFSEGMRGLRERGQDEALSRFVESGRIILGICLGCQMLLSNSEEFGFNRGLNLIQGVVVKIPFSQDPVPLVGWKQLRQVCHDHQRLPFPSINESVYAYFVHSYYCRPVDEKAVLATVIHGNNYLPAIVGKENVFGFQFHPEKSGAVGLDMLRDLLKLSSS